MREKEVRREQERITAQSKKVEAAHRMAVALADIVKDTSQVTKEEYVKAVKKVCKIKYNCIYITFT